MRMRQPWIRFCLGLIGLSGVAHAQLTPAEKEGLTQTLYLNNMTPADLGYSRVLFRDRWRMALVDRAIQEPMASADGLLSLHDRGLNSSPTEILAMGLAMIQRGSKPAVDPAGTVILPPTIPAGLQAPLRKLIGAVIRSNNDIRLATSALTLPELQGLMLSLPHLAAEESKVTFDFSSKAALSFDSAMNLMRRIDVDRIVASGQALEQDLEAVLPQLRAYTGPVATMSFKSAGLTIQLGGRGSDTHTGQADVLVDFGGSDRYSGSVGGALNKTAVALDLGGRNSFDLGDLSGGASVLGIGILHAFGDNDFRAGSLSLGSSIGGVGVLSVGAGDDDYDGKTLTQGFSMLGVGLLQDSGGNDRYRAQLYAQGCSRTLGLGWLIDVAGRDNYTAGGLSLNSPLFKDVYYSFAQGCSVGYREDTGGTSGGMGLLTDGKGDDQYWGETYCQAAAYWYGVGSLWDGGGHDTYSAYHYAQASAMHACGAYLFDLGGDDSYTTKFGASHSIGHDYGVSFLLDRAGNDIYVARDSAPGIGVANGVGMFLDSAGDDRYQGPAGQGNPARGTGSVGVFCDLGGDDKYRDGLNNAEAAIRPSWGMAYDADDPPRVSNGVVAQPAKPTPGSLPKPSDAELARLYSKAIQWAVGTAQKEAGESIDRLIGIGQPAVDWVLDKRLAQADRLSIRAIVQLINGVGDTARRALAGRLLTSENKNFNRIGLQVVNDAVIREAGPAVARFLSDTDLQKSAIRAAGAIKSQEAVEALLPFCADPDGNIALQAMISLASIGSDKGVPTAVALLTSSNFPLRRAALELVAKFPAQLEIEGRKLMGDPDETRTRIGIELLARLGDEPSLDQIAKRLLDPSPGVRIQCLLALSGRCPSDKRQDFLYLRNDPDPLVKALARTLEPIR